MCYTFSYSQGNNLFVVMDNRTLVDTIISQNDSIRIDLYRFKLDSNEIKYEYFTDEEGTLIKKICSSSEKMKIIEFVYKLDNNNSNHPFLINESEMNNVITYNDMLKAKDFNNLFNIIKSFQNIYLANKDVKCNGLLVVKRVELVPEKSNL